MDRDLGDAEAVGSIDADIEMTETDTCLALSLQKDA